MSGANQHFIYEGHRLIYDEFGSGDRWVVLVHGALMPRRMHQPLAEHLAENGAHVLTIDVLGHGESDKPYDSKLYGMTRFAEQVVALLDHVGVDQAIIGGTSLGANISLEVADIAPERVRGLVVEMPVLDHAIEFGVLAFAPLMFATKIPLAVRSVNLLSRAIPRGPIPFWPSIVLDTLLQDAKPMRAALKGVFFGRVAPPAHRRKLIEAPALVIGHPADPVHPFNDAEMLATEMRHATFVAAKGILEWRLNPDRLNQLTVGFITDCYKAEPLRVAKT